MSSTRRALIATSGAATLLANAATAQPASGAFRIVFMPCLHLRRDRRAAEGLAAALRAVEALEPRPALIVTGGDLWHDLRSQTGDQAQEMMDLFQRIWSANTRIPTRHLLGNHDWVGWSRDDMAEDDPSYGLRLPLRTLGMERNWYAFDHGGWRFVLLDNVDMSRKGRFVGTVPEEQLRFLRAQVSEDPRRPVLVFTHVPILTATEFHGGRGEVREDQWRLATNRMVDNPRAVLEAALGGNVRAFVSGHIHELDRIEVAGHRFICSGAVSGQQWGGPRIAGPLGTAEGFGLFDLRPDGDFAFTYQTFGWQAA